MKFKVYFLLVIVAGVFILALFLIYNSSPTKHFADTVNAEVPHDAKAYVLPLSEPNLLPLLNSEIPKPAISAKSFLVYDLKAAKPLWDKSSDTKLPIASLTKVLSALVVLDQVGQDEVVTIPKEAIRVDNEKQTLYLDEKITVENLMKVMLIESSNDAAYALADYVQKTQNVDFVQKMNEKALSLGMFNSYFMDPAGLDDNAFSTAEDLVKLVKYSLSYEKVWNFLKEKELIVTSVDGKISHTVKNTDQLLDVIPNIIGGKTGNTDQALGCMILIVDIPGYDDKIISIVLGSDDRFGDTEKIINWVISAYRWK